MMSPQVPLSVAKPPVTESTLYTKLFMCRALFLAQLARILTARWFYVSLNICIGPVQVMTTHGYNTLCNNQVDVTFIIVICHHDFDYYMCYVIANDFRLNHL